MESSVLIAPPLNAAALLDLPSHALEAQLDPDDAAFFALNDFRRESPITVSPDRLILDALDDMERLSVHALLVASGRQEDHAITGLITSADITRHLNGGEHRETRVRAAMTLVGELPLVHYESLESMTACDLYTMFQGTGLTHLLVVEQGEFEEVPVARGLLSRKSLAMRLHGGAPVLHG